MTDIAMRPRPAGAVSVGTATLRWEQTTGFGPYLRRIRQATGLSVRAAAAEIGLSSAYLSKLETGARPKPPSIRHLRRIGEVYGQDLREVMREAGFSLDVSPGVDAALYAVHERFRGLVTDPELRPARMDDRVLELIPAHLKRLWMEFARKLEALALRGGPTPASFLVQIGRSLEASALEGSETLAPSSSEGPEVWPERASFGAYLRQLRSDSRRTLRSVATEVGIAYSYLSMLESGVRRTPPSFNVLLHISEAYRQDAGDVMERAGFRVDAARDVEEALDDTERRFRELVLHPELMPVGMNDEVIRMVPELVRRQWLEFARKLEFMACRGLRTLSSINASPSPSPGSNR